MRESKKVEKGHLLGERHIFPQIVPNVRPLTSTTSPSLFVVYPLFYMSEYQWGLSGVGKWPKYSREAGFGLRLYRESEKQIPSGNLKG